MVDDMCATSYDAIICLGLGPLYRPASQCQLECLRALQQVNVPCYVYDPLFDADDISKLVAYGMIYKEIYTVEGNVLYFMPHCEMRLMDDVLRRRLDLLSTTTVFGTSYTSVRDRQLYKELSVKAPHWTNFINTVEDDRTPMSYTMKETPFTEEYWMVENSMNDMSLYTFQ